MSDVDKTRMIGLPYGEKNYDKMLSRFHLIRDTGTSRTDGRTDGQTHAARRHRAAKIFGKMPPPRGDAYNLAFCPRKRPN